jgi:transposase
VPRPYPREFRDDVVRVARNRDDGVTLEQVATDFGVQPMTLSKWMAAVVFSAEREDEMKDRGVEVWAERHRLEGHRPHPAPTLENPERWDCDCGGVNRILTLKQIQQKFAHLKAH